MRRVLIMTLGETPVVVTEALDILKREGKMPAEVVLLTTADSLTQESAGLLEKHIPEYYGINTVYQVPTHAYEDIDDENAVLEFMDNACGILKSNGKENAEVYVSIAGGRKTMSALMTLAVQIYGAKELFHIVAGDPELEERSRIDELRHLNEEEQERILHPDTGKIKYISMPFIGLFPWISDIVKALRGERVDRKDIKELLSSNGLIEDDKPTGLGKRFLGILERIESLPGPCPEEPKIHLSREPKFKREIESMTQKLRHRFWFICEISDSEWRKGEPKVKVEPPNKLKVYFPSRRGFNLSLILTTTANTSGELEACRREVDRFLGGIM